MYTDWHLVRPDEDLIDIEVSYIFNAVKCKYGHHFLLAIDTLSKLAYENGLISRVAARQHVTLVVDCDA